MAKLDAGDLGDSVPLVSGLKRPGQQGLFPNRRLGEPGVDEAAAEKRQPPHAPAPGRFNHVGLDLEVIEQEISWVAVVGLDAAHLGGRAVFQIQLGVAGHRGMAGVIRGGIS